MSRVARSLVAVTALALGAAVATIPTGCSRSAAPASATVRGRVIYAGEPLDGGLVVFAPDQERGGAGKPAQGELGPDGAFQLTLGGATAIPPGWYRVAIAPAPQFAPGSLRDRVPFPLDLSRPDRSTIVREVRSGGENVFEFTIERP